MLVGEFCNREAVFIDTESSVADAAGIMRKHHVGDVVVVNKRGGKLVPTGILTDRDIVLEIVATGTDPESVCVGDAMSFDLVTVDENDGFAQVLEVMLNKSIRRIPVVDAEGTLQGIVTLDDVIDLLGEMMMGISHLVGRQRHREERKRP